MTNPLKIYSGSNALRYTTPVNTGCRRRVQLMNEDSITVKFSDKTKMRFPVGTRIGDFYITKEQQEKYNASTGGYDYELKFDAYYWLWANRLLFYVMPGVTNAPKETSFKLTATIDVHAAVILRALNAIGFTYNGSPFRVDTDEGFSTEAKYISYANMSILGGIQAIADAYECEWWVVGNSIHFGKCNAIGEYDFTVGQNVASITSDAKTTTANRLVVFGSTRNLPPNYRTPESSDVVDAVVVKRLMLPEGTPYLQTSPDIPEDEIVEEEVVLDSVYPRTALAITDVETYDSTAQDGTTQTFYRVKYGTAFHFSKDYILPDEELHVVFESGDLNGMDFAVKFNPLGLAEKKDDGSINPDAQMFEIVANEDYGRSLPDAVLHPSKTDKFSLYGWDATKMEALGLLAAAEQELLTEGNKLLAEYTKDKQTYTCPMMWDWCKEQAEEGNTPRLGSVVNLHFVAGDTGRKSRIIGFEHDLDIEYSNVTYICGEKVSVSRLKTLESKVEGLTHDGTKVKVQNSLDFLSKRYSDRTAYQLASDVGFDVGQFLASVSGGRFAIDKVTGQSFLEVDRIFARVRAYFESLTVVERESLAGEQMVTPGGGVKCTSVEEVRDGQDVLTGWRCYFLSEQDGEKRETKIKEGDQAIAQTFNAKAGTTNKVSNHRWWRLVTGVSNNAYTDDSGNVYGYIEVSATDCEADSDIPKEGDDVIQFGNRTDKTRQAAILISTVASDAPSIKLLTGIDHYSLAGKDIISQGYDAAKGHAYFRCYGDTYIGAPDGSTYVKYDVDSKKLTVKADLEVGSTIGGKDAESFVKDLIPEIPKLTQEDIEDYVNNIINPKIEGIQDQIDGVIETWFYNGVPTLSNYPASDWNTDALKVQHLGDLYYDNDTGTAYRFSQKADKSYYWNVITDDAITKALAAAQKAQDTADGKRRTFTSQPTPPYDKGDIWVNATYPAGNTVKDAANGKYVNDILRCNTSRATGSFAIGDWGLASNYTDDTAALAASQAAQAAKDAADAAQSVADAAQSVADAAKNRLDQWAADGVISPTEKQAIRDEIARIDADKAHITAEYTRYSLGTPTGYNAAHSAYRAQLVTLSASTPENIAIPSDFTANQTAYYNQRTAALSAIATAAKKYADDVAKEEAEKATDPFKYLRENLLNAQKESTEISGGLIIATMMGLGYTENGARKLLAGMNGSYNTGLGGRTIASWYGGNMLDLFDKSDNRIANPTGQEATSLIRMDGSAYFLNGDIQFRSDRTAIFGSGATAITISNGSVKLGNGILIDIGGEAKGLGDSIASVTTLVNALSNVLVPVNSSGARVAWDSADLWAVKSVKGFYSEEFVSARGMNGQSSTVSRYLTDLLDTGISAPSSGQALVYNGSKWVNQAIQTGLDTAQLANYLTTNNYAKKSDIPSLADYAKKSDIPSLNGYATQSWVEGKGYLTSHQSLANYYTKSEVDTKDKRLTTYYASRPASANVNFGNNAGLYTFLATTSMTTGKPTEGDSHILHVEWDNSLSWAAQIALPTTLNASMQWRQQSGTTWQSWRTILDTSNYSSILDSRYYTESEINTKLTGYLARSGGNMTGSIGYTGSKATYPMISFIDNTADAYGNGIAVGGGGATIIGGGEAADLLKSTLSSGGDEKLILCNDGVIDFYTNCQNGLSSATHTTISGNLFSGVAANANSLGGKTASQYVTTDTAQTISGAKTFSSNIHISHATSADMSNATTNPMIKFSENGGQAVGIVYSDYDSYRASKGLKVMDVDGQDAGNVWLEAPKFIKSGGTSSQFLKADGSVDATPYLSRNGGTMANTNVVGNLNADLLDGVHLTDIRGVGYAMQDTWIDASALNADTWYPVTIPLSTVNNTRIEVLVALDSGTKPAWSVHDRGFSVRLIWESQGNGWGTNAAIVRRVYESSSAFANDIMPVRSIGQLTNSSTEYVFVRGGGKYRFRTSNGAIPTLRTSSYTASSQTVSPTTTAPAVTNRNVAFISDNVASATQLQTARTLWGQSFNGTANVSGDMTGVGSITASGNIVTSAGISATSIKIELDANNSVTGMGGEINRFGAALYLQHRGNATSPTGNLLMVCNGGNVGIGTTSPSYKLHVAGSILATSWIRTSGATGWYSETYGGGWYMTDSTWIRNYGSKSLYITGTIYASTGIYSDGYVSARGQNTSSDERLKNILRPLSLNVRDIADAPSVEFVWKKDGVKDVGSIAQYWRKLIPQLAPGMPDGSMGLQYGKTALMSVIAVAKKTVSLEERVAQLEAENRGLKAQISQLKTQLA